MQSSATVGCRAAVMVVCLIAIPLAAVFGTTLPDLIQDLLSRRWGTTPVPAKDSRCEAPPFRGFVRPIPSSVAQDDPISGEGSDGSHTPPICQSGPPGRIGPAGGTPNTRQDDAIWAGYDSPVEPLSASAIPAWPQQTGGGPKWGGSSASPTGSAATTAVLSDPTTVEPSPRDLVPVAEPECPPGSIRPSGPFQPPNAAWDCAARQHQSPQTTEQFARVQRRLRELGATYYRLETWGDQGQLYRFQARMAFNGNADYVRHFEVTDSDPLTAMVRLLNQVETWQAGR